MNKIRTRCIPVLIFVIIMFLLLVYKLYILMYIDNKDLQTSYNSQFVSNEKTCDINYDIVDCSGKELLSYNKKYYVVINPYIFTRNNSDTNIRELTALNYILKNYNSKYDLNSIEIKNETEKLYWEVDEATYNNVKKFSDVNGVYAYYVNEVDRSKAADLYNILTNPKDKNNEKLKGSNSLESIIYNKFKNSPFPSESFQNDINGNLISTEKVKSENISKVKLTIDKDINDKVQNILNESKLKEVCALVMRSDNGEIKAVSQNDTYKPNLALGLGGIYYPGSIFKAIVEEAAIESGSIELNKPIKDPGKYSEDKVYDYCTPEQAFVVSSNDVFIAIGQKTGFDNIYNMAKAQGLFDNVLSLDAESVGAMDSMDFNSTGNLSLLSFGQSIRITPIEALTIPNTVVNKGIYVKPHIVDSYIYDNGNKVEKENVEQKRVISEKTSNIMLEQFKKVLTDKNGTGSLAYTPNPCIGGKTGTAQRGEDKNKVIQNVDGWFVGFFNIKGINYSAVIFSPDISKEMSGGSTVAPIFKKIVEEMEK
ncbi:penicillin-binding transpeptidase domain-containing protein [Clostridium hydrogenum]|uniref:penicillin-binding transpeptidase domain-containing protein n=1 Tax=Clostridium hydrogenum TaxID=2855764 RepID=UPI001F3EEB12|nr:penicillin-binding transpeptidase domain-containing protein [Clostridium hydrogenum]